VTPEEIKKAAETYDEIVIIESGKRCGLAWTPWMGDWFTSYSPRNINSHAEGYWDHWVDLAIKVLKDPLTAIVRPDAHAAAAELAPLDQYSGADRELIDEELVARFATPNKPERPGYDGGPDGG
jgi:hypothetical protein